MIRCRSVPCPAGWPISDCFEAAIVEVPAGLRNLVPERIAGRLKTEVRTPVVLTPLTLSVIGCAGATSGPPGACPREAGNSRQQQEATANDMDEIIGGAAWWDRRKSLCGFGNCDTEAEAFFPEQGMVVGSSAEPLRVRIARPGRRPRQRTTSSRRSCHLVRRSSGSCCWRRG